MDPKLKNALPKIQEWLKLDEFPHFKIGITNDLERRGREYNVANWQLFEIATGSADKICKAETELITLFTDPHHPLHAKCKNEPGTGGIGAEQDTTILYIALEHQPGPIPIEELHAPFTDIPAIHL